MEDDHALEDLYENNVSKIMEETSKKSVRMMLPIKTQNGLLKKHVIEEDNEVIEEEDQITDNNQKENEENNQENSDIEMDIDTYVRI